MVGINVFVDVVAIFRQYVALMAESDFQSYHERRQHQRERIEIQVNIWNDVLNMTGVVFDLSGGGMSVLTPKMLPNQSDVKIAFEVPNNGGKVTCMARVVWSSDSRRAGLKFADLDEESRRAVAQWVSDQNLKALSSKGPGL